MRGIFISYRHSDSAAMCDRIYAALAGSFGKEAIFKDIDNIPLGVNFAEYIRTMVAQSAVVVAIIGRTWLDTSDAHGRHRLNDPSDFVRLELEEALAHTIPVVPLLVDGATFPPVARLPTELRGLLAQNGWEVHHDPYFEFDMRRVISGLERWVPSLQTRQTALAHQRAAVQQAMVAAQKRTQVPARSRVHMLMTYPTKAPATPKPPLPRRWLLSYGARPGIIAAAVMALAFALDSLVTSPQTQGSIDAVFTLLLIAPIFIAAITAFLVKSRFDRIGAAVQAAMTAATPMWASFWIGAFATQWQGFGFSSPTLTPVAYAIGVVFFSIFVAGPEAMIAAACGLCGCLVAVWWRRVKRPSVFAKSRTDADSVAVATGATTDTGANAV